MTESRPRAGSERTVARVCFAATLVMLGMSTLEGSGMLGADAATKRRIERALREFRRTAVSAVRFGESPEDAEDD